MDYIGNKVEELLKKVSKVKQWLIRDTAHEYYRKGYEEGQKLVYRTILRKQALEDFCKVLLDCGVKLTYDYKRGGLIVSVRNDKVSNLQNLIKLYVDDKKSKGDNIL